MDNNNKFFLKKKSYSTHGEDLVVKKYFKEIKISTIRTGIEKYLTHFKKNDN